MLRLKNEVSSKIQMRGQCGHLHWLYHLPTAVHMTRNDWPAVQHPSNPENWTKFDVLTVVPVEIKEFQDITGRECVHHMMQKLVHVLKYLYKNRYMETFNHNEALFFKCIRTLGLYILKYICIIINLVSWHHIQI